MDKWQKTSIMAALLLAGAGLFYRFAFVLPQTDHAAAQGQTFRVALRNDAYERCRREVHLVHDVHWAAACMVSAGENPAGAEDGHAECMLPDAKAAVLNAALDEAEAGCRAEAGIR